MIGSFNDLTNADAKVSSLPLDEVKASPSFYSPNDGGFNSEENMRWATKKQVTKNFVIGNTVDDVNNSLKTTITGDSISLADGMFSIDGYTFKIANSIANISYDKGLNTTADNLTLSTKYAQRFVETLTNYGNSDALKSDFDEFCFSKFLPSDPECSDNWIKASSPNADLNNKVVGYVKFAYRDSFKDNIDISTDETYVSFKNNKIDVRNINLPIGGIDSYIDSLGDDLGKPFAVISDSTVIYIHYPVFSKETPESNLNNREIVVYFNDIFGLLFTHSQSFEQYTSMPNISFGTPTISHSNFYPATESKFVDMNANTPLGAYALNFTKCDLFTEPSNIYNYTLLYNNGTRFDTSYNTEISNYKTQFDFTSSAVLNNFGLTIKSQSDENMMSAINNFMQTHEGAYVGNTLSYYCLLNPDPDLDPSNQPIVLFMSSDGKLCPDGFHYMNAQNDESTTNEIAEGYVHFLKRKYVESNGLTLDPDDVPTSDLITWLNGNGSSLFDRCLQKQTSYYINLCYSSIMENTIYNSSNSDSECIKSSGCGVALLSEKQDYVEDHDFYVSYEYTYGDNLTTEIKYSKDATSDKYKLNSSVMSHGQNIVRNVNNCMEYKTHFVNIVNPMLTYDDPINLLCKASLNPNSSPNVLSSFELTYVGDLQITNTFNNIVLDDNLMPVCPDTSDIEESITFIKNEYLNAYFITSDYSLAESLRFTFNINTWYCNIPTVISVKKDGSNYLYGSVEDEGVIKYGGIEISNKLPQDIEDLDLYIYSLNVSSTDYVINNVSCPFVYVSLDQPAYVQRNAFLHTSKIYGDDGKSFEEVVKNMILSFVEAHIFDFEERIRRLEITIYGDDENPGLEDIVLGNEDLEITGNVYDISELEERVTLIEDELLNLLQDAGIIGPEAMYFIKKFGITNITGTGNTYDYPTISSSTTSPLNNNDLVKYIFIADGITSIGTKLFYHCGNIYSINSGQATKVSRIKVSANGNIVNKSIDLLSTIHQQYYDAVLYPGALKVIVQIDDHKYIYVDNRSGQMVHIKDKEIPVGTVDYKTGLVTFDDIISAPVTVQFRYCTLKEANTYVADKIPNTVVTIGNQAFAQNIDKGYKRQGLKNVTFGNNISQIGYACFWGNALQTITLPTTLSSPNSVGPYVFAHCEDLETVIYGANTIPDHAFNWCSSLYSVTIYNTVQNIGTKCFSYDICDNNGDGVIITFWGTAEQWLNIQKGIDWASKLTNASETIPDSGPSVSNITRIECWSSSSDTSPTSVFTDTGSIGELGLQTLNSVYYYSANSGNHMNEFQLTKYNGNEISDGEVFIQYTSGGVDNITLVDCTNSTIGDISAMYNSGSGVEVGTDYSPTTPTATIQTAESPSSTIPLADTNYQFIYVSSNPDVIEVVHDGANAGDIKVKQTGEATIYVALLLDGNYITDSSVTLTAISA